MEIFNQFYDRIQIIHNPLHIVENIFVSHMSTNLNEKNENIVFDRCDVEHHDQISEANDNKWEWNHTESGGNNLFHIILLDINLI